MGKVTTVASKGAKSSNGIDRTSFVVVVIVGIAVAASFLLVFNGGSAPHELQHAQAAAGTQDVQGDHQARKALHLPKISPETFVMDDTFAWVDACANVCATQGFDDADFRFLQRAMASGLMLDPGRPLNLMDVARSCMIRCTGKAKAPSEHGYAAKPASRPSQVVNEYLKCADRCTPGAPVNLSSQSDAALASLASCGVVHLHDVFPLTLLAELAEAARKLRANEFGDTLLSDMLSAHNLRAERQEIWLPFEAPFNDHRLLQAPALLHLINEYFNSHSADRASRATVLAHVNLIVSKQGVADAQALHSDVDHAGRHLNVHIPLQDVSLTMGPTRLCPCTRNFTPMDVTTKNIDILHHIQLVKGLDQTCEQFQNTHYDAVSSFGEVTLYDGAMRHKGLANQATVDRPLLVLTFAASEADAVARNYTGHLPTELPVADTENQKFATVFSQMASATYTV